MKPTLHPTGCTDKNFTMLKALDYFLTFFHLAIIAFNLFAWIPARTRRAHLVLAGITLGSWFILGIWKGMGYCPVTDWQWDIKRRLGEGPLPPSFVTWFVQAYTPLRPASAMVDGWTGGLFAAAILASLFANFGLPVLRKKGPLQ